jgi:hypothetical protein
VWGISATPKYLLTHAVSILKENDLRADSVDENYD